MLTPSVQLSSGRRHFLLAPFDTVTPGDLVALLDGSAPGTPFRYVVTPNVDHVVRLRRSIPLVAAYEAAWLSICDSKPITALARAFGSTLPHLSGATLTEILFQRVIRPGDAVGLVVASEDIATEMGRAFPTIRFAVLVARPNLTSDPDGLQDCIDFVIRSRTRFVFIAIGSPLSETIAFHASLDPRATGTGLCVGAALEFLVGRKSRAPRWMQRSGLEWVHRFASEPRRLWRRYVFGVLPLAQLVLFELAGRTAARRGLRGRPAGG